MGSEKLTKHFVTFYSPGTFFDEETTRPIEGWDVGTAVEMAGSVLKRHGAAPYGFQFSTRERGPDDLDSHVATRSALYYLGGRVETIDDVRARRDPKERILLRNMEGNGWDRIIHNNNSWLTTRPLRDDDIVLDYARPAGRLALQEAATPASQSDDQGGRDGS